MRLTLRRDILAGELAMDSPEGYPADAIIGRAGTSVKVVDFDGPSVEVSDFSEDPFAFGWISVKDVL